MKTLVLGGGVVGVTTAYFLARAGHEVTLVEQQDALGLEATGGNAGIIAPGHSFAWASPRAPAMLWQSLRGAETAIRVRLTADPQLYAWGLRFLREERDVVRRFTRAFYEAQRWIARSDAKQISELIAPAFPDIAPEIRRRVVARYLEQATWSRDPIVRRPGYEYLETILLDGGFITRRHRYEDLIDTTVARDVVG